MSELVIVALVVLWVLVVLLSIAVVALARQVGILHERVAPAGALMPTSGPKVGEVAEPVAVTDLDGRRITIGGPAGGEVIPTLVMFVSPTCPVCKMLVPTAISLARHENLNLIFASDGDTPARHKAYVRDLQLESYPYVISEALGIQYGVSKLPFALLLGADGTLLSKGLVNTREHLESLVEATRLGVNTLQEYVQEFDPSTMDAVKEAR